MTFSIVLDQQGAYATGSILTGHVVLVAEKDQAIDSVFLTFTGTAKVQIVERRQRPESSFINGQQQMTMRTETFNYHSTGLYFAHSFNVMAGDPGQWGAGTYKWPFTVQIPLRAEELNDEKLKEHGAQIFAPEPPWLPSFNCGSHALPDTFYYKKYSHQNSDITVSVRYKLTAKLTRPKASYVLFSGNKDAEVDVLIRSNAPQLSQSPAGTYPSRSHTATIKSLRLLPEYKDGHLSFREKTHSLFHHSSLPRVSLQISVSAPGILDIHSDPSTPLPFLISIVRVPISPEPASKSKHEDSQIPTPEIFLKRLRLRLAASTRVRTTGGAFWHREHNAPAISYFDIYDQKMKDVAGKEHIPIANDGRWTDVGRELGIVLGSMTTGDGAQALAIVPNFTTFNIWRGYVLGWKIELCCCAGEEEIEFEIDPGTGDGLQLTLNGGGGQGVAGDQIPQAQIGGQYGYGNTAPWSQQQSPQGGYIQQPQQPGYIQQPVYEQTPQVMGSYGHQAVGGNYPDFPGP